jgi:hypothetical protein
MAAESWVSAGVAAFDAAAPAGPFTIHAQVMAEAASSLAPIAIAPSSSGGRRFALGTLTLVERPGDRWAVRDLTIHGPVRYLDLTGHWSAQGGDGPNWEAAYWHAFDLAVRLAQDDHRCLSCGALYTVEARAGARNSAICCVPTEDEAPVAGYGDIEIPAWCATRRAFVWRNASGEVEADR